MFVMRSENTKTIATMISCPISIPKLKYTNGKKTFSSLPNIDLSKNEKPNP